MWRLYTWGQTHSINGDAMNDVSTGKSSEGDAPMARLYTWGKHTDTVLTLNAEY